MTAFPLLWEYKRTSDLFLRTDLGSNFCSIWNIEPAYAYRSTSHQLHGVPECLVRYVAV
jgi:hypothetical protein